MFLDLKIAVWQTSCQGLEKVDRSSFFTACSGYSDNPFEFIDQNVQQRLSPDELVKAALCIICKQLDNYNGPHYNMTHDKNL